MLTAIADGLVNYLETAFRDGWHADTTAERACIARLIDGRDECPHRYSGMGKATDAPPHHPPHADHPDLWLDTEGNPVAHATHLYHLERDHLADLLAFADR